LVVADWAVDARAVVSACAIHLEHDRLELGLLVPASLHGLNWMGDPKASRPCARRQLNSIGEVARTEGVDFTFTGVGDADVLTAICDALAAWRAHELLLCSRGRRHVVAHRFSLAYRARRLSALPVRQVVLPGTDTPARRSWPARWRTARCVVE